MNGLVWDLVVAAVFAVLAVVFAHLDQPLVAAAAGYEAWSWFKEAPASPDMAGGH